MRADRLDMLAGDVWAFIFDQLDAESDWTWIDAGRVAAVVERAYRAAVPTVAPDCRDAEDGAVLFCEFCGSGPECAVCGGRRP
jgi:hypothetical protein